MTTETEPPRPAAPSRTKSRGRRAFDLAKRTLKEFSDDRVLALAAGVTFYTLLAIFPAIAALVSIYGFFAAPGQIASEFSTMAGLFPGGMIDVVGDQLKRLAAQRGGTLSIGFVVGLGIALWSASSGMKGLFDALNVVYGEKERRSYLRLSGVALLFTLGSIVFLLLAFAAIVGLPIILNSIGLETVSGAIISIARWPALLVIAALGLAILYRYGPSRAVTRWRWLSWGGVLASLLWIGGSLLFSWYVANFGSYNKMYGSLGAVIGFMTWIWLSATIILLGAELNSELEPQIEPEIRTDPR